MPSPHTAESPVLELLSFAVLDSSVVGSCVVVSPVLDDVVSAIVLSEVSSGSVVLVSSVVSEPVLASVLEVAVVVGFIELDDVSLGPLLSPTSVSSIVPPSSAQAASSNEIPREVEERKRADIQSRVGRIPIGVHARAAMARVRSGTEQLDLS
jgi:hypothetical protein